MNRPLHVWLAFAGGLALVLAAMGWASLTVLRLERAEEQAQRQAEREANARLALWRMDSELSPLIARESGRPYFAYGSFYPAERAYTQMYNDPATVRNGEALLPSRLLTEAPPQTLLHFQFDPSGALTSPQVPAPAKRELAASVCATAHKVNAAAARLAEFQKLVALPALLENIPDDTLTPLVPSAARAWDGASMLAMNAQEGGQLAAAQPAQTAAREQDGQQMELNPAWIGNQANDPERQRSRTSVEWQRRQQAYQSQSKQTLDNKLFQSDGAPAPQAIAPQMPLAANPRAFSDVREGLLKPVWAGSALLLARRVSIDGKLYVQGCWLDWPAIRGELLANIRDLLPAADLEAVKSEPGEREAYMLAALPVALVPGAVPLEPSPLVSPLRLSLLIAWACVLLGAAAVALLLSGAISLSERRGAFVSAVTHELRTPLTTFRLYTEMLAGGMVPDEEKRLSYLNTLRVEAERLSHLVENVLAYARLEKGSTGSRLEDIAMPDLIAKVTARLSERAAQCGMTIVIEVAPASLPVGENASTGKVVAPASLPVGENASTGTEAGATVVRTDSSAVEQILFNLVDNACKYAGAAADNSIHISGESNGRCALLRVRDRGPGLSGAVRGRLFEPFCKSARDAAHSAPGVGLGLALSRRLARQMGGDLKLDASVTDGACFVLSMPLAE